MEILLGKNKEFYKANLHCHSTISDGRASVEQIKKEYLRRGYSVVAFTDHDAIHNHSHLTDEKFLALTSFELAVKEDENLSTLNANRMKCIHMNLYSMNEDETLTPFYSSIYDKTKEPWKSSVRHGEEFNRVYSPECINEIIKGAHERGFLVSLNHPSWSLQDATDYLQYEGLDFVEVVNFGCVRAGYNDDEHVIDTMIRHGKRVFCIATDDNHNPNGLFDDKDSDSFGGFVMIDAPALEYGVIMDALKRGDFYASSGPEIYSLTKEGSKVKINCSDARGIYLHTDTRIIRRSLPEKGEYLREAEFELNDEFDLFRITVVDKAGKKAYTQLYDRAL